MYCPEHFTEKDANEIDRIMAAFPLATLVVSTEEGLLANHIPLLRQGDDQLIGHIAKANDLHHLVENNSEVLAIFQAEEAYISPNYYPTKPETHRHVPTWNYQVVHCHGRINFDHSTKAKTAIVGRLTSHFERQAFGDQAWRMADAPKDYMAGMLDNIVGFTIDIARVVAKSKLSQNRDPVDYDNVADVMMAEGKHGLGQRMKSLKNTD